MRKSIDLSENSWILCPKNEVERLKIFNPKIRNLMQYINEQKRKAKPFICKGMDQMTV